MVVSLLVALLVATSDIVFVLRLTEQGCPYYLAEMKFRFCGDLDCPDWVLAEINTLSKMSSIRLKVLVTQILAFCLAGEMNYEKVLKLAADNADGVSDIKGAVAAIHFMLTSAAKYDVDDRVLIQEVQQLGLPKENSETVCKQYRDAKEALRAKFEESSYRISKLVSTDWRVDQVLASSSGSDSSSGRIVHIKMNIDNEPDSIEASSSRFQDFALELSAEQLDVLIHELSLAQQLMQNIQ